MKKLYVGNLSFQATEQDVQNFFVEAGVTPDSIALVRDRFSGQPRGFGFVEITNDEDALRAIESLNGKNLMGRNVVVNEARPQTPRPGGGGGGAGLAADAAGAVAAAIVAIAAVADAAGAAAANLAGRNTFLCHRVKEYTEMWGLVCLPEF